MKKITILMIGICFFFSMALVGQADESQKETVDKNNRVYVKLKGSQFNAAAIGNATFVSTGENSSSVTIIMSRITSSTIRPLRIYTYIYPGSCENLGETPAYELNDIKVTYDRGGNTWEANRRIPVALSSLLENDYALVIRSTAADGNLDLFCGDIR
jgi:hypothetical protein